MTRRPAAFLDRDGVLIEDSGFPHDPGAARLIPGAMAAIRRLDAAGYAVCVVTNQSGVGRGLFDEAQVARMHLWLAGESRAAGGRILGFAHCPHHPEAGRGHYRRDSPRRKPGPGMILDWFAHMPLARAGSFLIGDRDTDMLAAAAAGIPGHLFASGDLDAFAARILES